MSENVWLPEGEMKEDKGTAETVYYGGLLALPSFPPPPL